MRGTLRNVWMRVAVALALAPVLVGGMVATAYASPARGAFAGLQPDPFTCEFITGTQDRFTSSSLDPVQNTNAGYKLTVEVQFAYDAGTWCYTQSMAVIQETGNVFGGTLHLMLNNCTNQVDSVAPSFPGGGGTFTYFGNHASAQGCAFTNAYLQTSNGIRLPALGNPDANSGHQSA